MRPQTSEYSKKHLFLIYRSTQAVETNIPAQSKRVEKIERCSTAHGPAPLPRALVLYRRLHSDAEFIGGPGEGEVTLALYSQVVRRLRCRDHSHGVHDDNVRMRLRHFVIASANGTSENGVRTEVIVPQICVPRTWYRGLARNLLCCLVSPRAHVNQVDPKLLQLAG